MLPFDRLIRAVDEWALAARRDDLYAQIGDGDYKPCNMMWTSMLSPREFTARIQESALIIAHAGMGTIITALDSHKPLVLLPRLAAKREVTTDHQVHTAARFRGTGGIFVAERETELGETIEMALSRGGHVAFLPSLSRAQFLERIRTFIHGRG